MELRDTGMRSCASTATHPGFRRASEISIESCSDFTQPGWCVQSRIRPRPTRDGCRTRLRRRARTSSTPGCLDANMVGSARTRTFTRCERCWRSERRRTMPSAFSSTGEWQSMPSGNCSSRRGTRAVSATTLGTPARRYGSDGGCGISQSTWSSSTRFRAAWCEMILVIMQRRRSGPLPDNGLARPALQPRRRGLRVRKRTVSGGLVPSLHDGLRPARRDRRPWNRRCPIETGPSSFGRLLASCRAAVGPPDREIRLRRAVRTFTAPIDLRRREHRCRELPHGQDFAQYAGPSSPPTAHGMAAGIVLNEYVGHAVSEEGTR